VEIEIWADLVCPWCYIGKRRLQNALERTGTASSATIVHRAFQLDPNASTHSEPTVDHLASKYGVSRDQALDMMANVTDVAATEGLHYRLDLTMTGNTRDAHRLVLWAQDTKAESAQPLMEALYSAYFEHGRSIFTIDDLTGFAIEVGLDPEQARAMLEGRDYLDRISEDQALARDFGASGVPFFVFDRTRGLSGAQPLELFERALTEN
jgi:predicted DsbA family dithiol-disulfide isomerase